MLTFLKVPLLSHTINPCNEKKFLPVTHTAEVSLEVSVPCGFILSDKCMVTMMEYFNRLTGLLLVRLKLYSLV